MRIRRSSSRPSSRARHVWTCPIPGRFGPSAAFDVAHYRVNLAQLQGLQATDALLPGDPAWDVEAALGYLDWWDGRTGVDAWPGYWPQLSAETARSRLERFAARAVAALG